jgi:glucose-1-phosphate cytidylyltransferase
MESVMKAVILAGGLGTRLSEETDVRPKPMVEIGGKPILWHIMKMYSAHGVNDFVICCGYRGYMIKEYFANYFLHMSDVTFDVQNNKMEVHSTASEPWRVTVVDTGENSGTGGRLRRVRHHLDETFCFTYGDGLSDVNVANVIEFHKRQQVMVTLTAVQPAGRFGTVELSYDGMVDTFEEKIRGDGGWVNAGFAVVEPSAIDYIANDLEMWEAGPLEQLTKEHQVAAFRHQGFWQPMDTLRDKQRLEELWTGPQTRRATDQLPVDHRAPWKVW